MAKDRGEPEPAETAGGQDASSRLTSTAEGLFHRIRTGEWPVLKIDLSEAYANVRRRANTLRRRRIIAATLAGIVLAGLGTVVGTYYVSAIPLPEQLNLPETTTIYYSDGTTVMARLGSQRRTVVPPESLPPYVGQAVIAAEDPQYWATSGTLISRQYARAATVARGEAVTGTAAEAKLLVLTWKLEDLYSKEEILGFYLNTVYFGRGAYGIEEASRAYFGVSAARLTLAQAILLAGIIESPGDGRFDPTVDVISASTKFATVAQSMVSLGALDQATARRLNLPRVLPYDPQQFTSGLDAPTGLVVAQVLAELRGSDPFRGRPPGFLADGGFHVVTTIDVGVQRVLETTVDETRSGSLLFPQPRNVRAAAVIVQPGTGRVLGYYGGHNGTGADYAGTRADPEGGLAGFGYHPPAHTMSVYTLTAALQAGISVRSRWQSPSLREFASRDGPVRDVRTAPCQPACTLAEAATVPLSVPFYAVGDRVGAAAVIDAARALGVQTMWTPGSASSGPVRYDLTRSTGASVVPEPFDGDVALGRYPVTVLDQATAMATLAAQGQRAPTHFVARVTRGAAVYYTEPTGTVRAIDPAVAADVTGVLVEHAVGHIAGGPASASMAGSAPFANSLLDTTHAWLVGYTPHLAVAVWVGNQDAEFPLVDAVGDRITGDTLPAAIYRALVAGATDVLDPGPAQFPAPADLGDPTAGDASSTDASSGDAP